MAYLDTGDLPWDMELNDSNEVIITSLDIHSYIYISS